MHRSSIADREFLRRFESCELAPPFSHADHVRLAYVHLTARSVEASLPRVRTSLHRYLRHHGVDPAKYHETLTCGSVVLVHSRMQDAPQTSTWESFAGANPDLLISGVMSDSDDPLAQWRDWPRLNAVQNDAFVTLPADLINRATPRMLDAVAQACETFDRFRGATP